LLEDDQETGNSYQEAWALYFSKYLTAYEKALDLPIWAITIQNEPEAMTGNIVYEGLHMTAEDQRKFLVNHLGPRLKADHPDVDIYIYDHNKDHIVKWVKTILGDPEARKYVKGTAFHWYTGPYFENLDEAHELFPEFPLLSTESTVAKQKPHTYNEPDWEKGEHYGSEIMGDLNHWSTGFIDWNLLLDGYGGPNHADPTGKLCEGLIKCGSDGMIIADHDQLEPQVFYYYMGHFSKWIVPGSVRIGFDLQQIHNGERLRKDKKDYEDVDGTAFLTPDNTVVIVLMNRGKSKANMTIHDGENSLSLTLKSHSIQTLIYPKFGEKTFSFVAEKNFKAVRHLRDMYMV